MRKDKLQNNKVDTIQMGARESSMNPPKNDLAWKWKKPCRAAPGKNFR